MSPWLYGLPLAAYLVGAVPFGFLLAKALRGVDLREAGSGNIGATNAARVLGFRFFPLVFALDVAKGLLPTLAAVALVEAGRWDPPPLVVATGLAAVLGHIFPVYLGFRGGKAVATGTGVFLALAPWAALIAAAVWGLVFGAWRYVSLASICAAAALPAAACALHVDPFGSGVWLAALAALGGGLVIARHHGNIRRLLAGTERRAGRPRAPAPPEGAQNEEDTRT